MFDDVARMSNHARGKDLAVRQLHALEQVILVFVTRVGGLEAERTGIDLEDIVYDLGQLAS